MVSGSGGICADSELLCAVQVDMKLLEEVAWPVDRLSKEIK